MGFKDDKVSTHHRTIKCDGPGCDKKAYFEISDIEAIQKIEWLAGLRVVQTGDNRQIAYCSDVCEVKGVTTGTHNLLPKKEEPTAPMIVPATAADVQAAVAGAAKVTAIDEALKSGNGEAPVTLD